MAHSTRSGFRRVDHKMTTLFAVFALLLSILACAVNLPGNDPPADATSVARSVESTINAETVATMQAEQTLTAGMPIAAPTQDPGVSETLQAQQATLDAQATSLVPQETQVVPTEGSLATLPPIPGASLEPTSITDWKMYFWVPLNSGCKLPEAPCWKLADDWKKAQTSTGEGIFISKVPVLIDPAWEKPYLVFWNKYLLRQTGTVEIQVNGDWIMVKNLGYSRSDWRQEAIDLQPYKGKEMIVRFISQIGYYQQSSWFVQDVKIVPNYKP